MYGLVTEIMNETLWDDLTHLQTVVTGAAADMMSSLAQSGHSYAMQAASSRLSASQHMNEVYGGISQIQLLNQQQNDIERVLPELAQKLKVIHQ